MFGSDGLLGGRKKVNLLVWCEGIVGFVWLGEVDLIGNLSLKKERMNGERNVQDASTVRAKTPDSGSQSCPARSESKRPD